MGGNGADCSAASGLPYPFIHESVEMESKGFIVIQGWMVNELHLSGNELICYALVYGFSQDGETEFKGSHSYVAQSLGVTKDNARRILSRLVEKGLVRKRYEEISGVRFCRYSANRPAENGAGDDTAVGATAAPGGASNQCRPGIETVPNNIIDNIDSEEALSFQDNAKKEQEKAILRRRERFRESLVPFSEKYGVEMLRDFFGYWTEMNKSMTKMRFEQQPTWETSRRLSTWAKNERNYGNRQGNGAASAAEQRRREIADAMRELLQEDN